MTIQTTRQLNHNRAAIDALASERQRAVALTTSAEQRLRTVREALARLNQKSGQPAQTADLAANDNMTTTGQKTVAKSGPGARRIGPQTIIANNPRMLAEYAKHHRLALDFGWGGLAKALGLSAEQTEKMKDQIFLHSQGFMDLKEAAEMDGLDPNSEGFHRLEVERGKLGNKKFTEILGDIFPLFREWGHTWPVRDRVVELAGTAIYSGEPLTSTQVERATQILAANSQRLQTGRVDDKTINWNTASVHLQGVLSPAQIATLGDIIEYGAKQRKTDARQTQLTAEFKAKQPRP
ncbi:MAG: hypothetical protein Q7S40_02600 [Opitutaceae bacterium]|nr:hypothetical protein [Opitutaceae bacterium]